MTSLDEKFLDFCKSETSETFGGVNDTFSIEQIKEFKSDLQSVKQDKQGDFIIDEIENVKRIEKDIRDMRENFEKISDKNNSPKDIINNSFPLGNNDEKNKQSIENTTLEQLTKSEEKFIELSKSLFPDIFKDANTSELESIFGTIIDYPTIDPSSFGLMSIEGLQKLFIENYHNKKIDKKDFFDKFLNNLSINKNELDASEYQIKTNDCKDINDEIKHYYFNSKLWYEGTDKSFEDYDSYGIFIKNPSDLSQKFVFYKFSETKKNEITGNSRAAPIIYREIIQSIKTPNILYTPTANYNYNYNRIKYDFNSAEFMNSIRSFLSNPMPNLNINQIILELQLSFRANPININDINSDEYKKIRYLFNYSNIVTTYITLLSHFFKNISQCYNIYNKIIQKLKRKSIATNGNTSYRNNDLLLINKKIGLLIAEFGKLIIELEQNLLNQNLLEPKPYDTARDNAILTNNFVGFRADILFKDKNADSFISQYNIFDENKFKFILQKYFFNHKLNFGGIPFSLDENEKYNRHILICLSFFFNYRILSNKTFLDFLDILKKENNE